MKLQLIAAAALMACGAAQALTPSQIVTARNNGSLEEVYLAGASAQRLFIGAWFQEQCTPNSFDVFFNGSGAAPSGSSYRAYSCNLKKKVGNWASGTPVLLVKRDTGGSFEGVNPIALGQPQTNMVVDNTCTATANPRPATDITLPTFGCPGTDNFVSDAGVSDVEPVLFQRPVNLPDGQAALTTAQLNKLNIRTINQTIFGVIVNKKAYAALQQTQGLSASEQPSLPFTFVAAAFSGSAEGGPAKRGWNVVIDSSVDPQVQGKQVNVCRRTVGSGTQATSNVFFLNNPGAGATIGYTPFGQALNGPKTASVGANVGTIQATGTRAVQLGAGTSNVETCVGTTAENAPGDAYAIGYLSRENSPLPTGLGIDKGYRFVKLDGQTPVRDVAKQGNYPVVFNATMQWNTDTLNNADQLAFVTALRSNAGRAASLDVADVDTQQGVLAAPSTYSGAWEDITDPVTRKFASRVDRLTNNSNSTLRIVK